MSDYSHKDFTNRNLLDRTDLDGQYIRSSCFSQEKPDTQVFPDSMSGVTFVNCNLDNCIIPDGNEVIDCSTTRYEVQNDLNDWEVDEEGNPLCIMDYLYHYKFGVPLPDPFDIPEEPVDKPIDYRSVA